MWRQWLLYNPLSSKVSWETPTIKYYYVNLGFTHTSFSGSQQFNWKTFLRQELIAVRLYIYWSLNREMEGKESFALWPSFVVMKSGYQRKNDICSCWRGSAYKPGHKERQSNFLSYHTPYSIYEKNIFFFCLHGNSIALLLLILEGLCSQACVSGSATTGFGIHQCVTSLKHHLCWHYIMIYVLFRVLTAIRNPWASSASGKHPAI